jgi:nucleoside-diphosphate-sugar epimerase
VKLLVTGGTGFTGRALLRFLADRGDHVYALHRPGGVAPEALPGVEPIAQDLAAPLDPGLPEAVDAVVHLAQSPRYREFPDGAVDVFEVNSVATVRLLDWARRAGAKSFVYASSGAVYAPSTQPAEEDQGVSPGNFYAASKRSGELACEQFRGILRAHVLRFFFIYGPGQTGMFIPGVLERIRRGDQVQLGGQDGLHVNPVFVDDAVAAVVGVAGAPESLTLNVAGPDVVSLRELSERAGELLGQSPTFSVGDQGGDVLASIERLRAAGLGPRISFDEGLQRTVAALPPAN